MKKLMLGLVLVALVACMVQPVFAQTGYRVVTEQPMRWIKGASTDSTNAYIAFNNNAISADTTAAFDLRQICLPMRTFAADTSMVVGALLNWDSEAVGDSLIIATQYSLDGTNWTYLNASTGCWEVVLGASNQVHKSVVNGLSRSTAQRNGCSFVRWLVQHWDQSRAAAGASGILVELRPVIWKCAEAK